ncbi:MAG: helix-turn-helix domain-containing protein [Trichodesmium sp. MAG_R03]|nr:helix-turn-helix domain-containing protein [Trichodesmium sp. MAG_R03]
MGQKTRLARLFVCVHIVWNDNLAFCKERHKLRENKPVNSELQKQLITQANFPRLCWAKRCIKVINY